MLRHGILYEKRQADTCVIATQANVVRGRTTAAPPATGVPVSG